MSTAELIEGLKAMQSKLVRAMQEEYFCDDVVPPPSAFGWGADALRAFFESGGEALPDGTAVSAPAAPPAAAAPPVAAPPRELGPPDTIASGRPIFLALGDSLTEFGQHVCDPAWDKKAPFASEVLQRQQMDIPIPEHGPGWITLLQRDYSYRTAADVLNRGYSGCTTRQLRHDLPEIISSLNRQDVFAVSLMLGSNDHVPSPCNVPKEEFKQNLAAIVAMLQEALPKAKIILITPGRINKEKWAQHVSTVTAGRLDGRGRGETLTGVMTQGSSGSSSDLKQYIALCCEVGEAAGLGSAGVNPLKGPKGAVLNLNYMMQYQLASYHEAEHPDGYHFSAKLNRFVYKSIRDTLEGMQLSPVQMPMHRPAAIAELQSTCKYGPSDEDGRLRKRV